MDLSHETYVHPTSIGQLEIIEAPARAESDEHSVTLTRWMHNIEPPPFWAANLKSTEKCDRWQICQFSLPANVMIDVGVALAGSGAPQGNRSKGVTGIVVNLMTPETETSTWYFWGMTRNFDIDDRGLTGRIRDAQAKVFGEDLAYSRRSRKTCCAGPIGSPSTSTLMRAVFMRAASWTERAGSNQPRFSPPWRGFAGPTSKKDFFEKQ